jgi:hypothetical protein
VDTSAAQNTQSSALDGFIEQLIKEKGFPDLSDEVKEEIKTDLLGRADDFITAKLISALSDDKVAQFEAMLKEGKPQEETQKFLQDSIPDFTNVVSQALMEFRDVYLGLTQAPASEVPDELPPTPVSTGN